MIPVKKFYCQLIKNTVRKKYLFAANELKSGRTKRVLETLQEEIQHNKID